MRETINDLLGRLGEKKPSEENHDRSDSGKSTIASFSLMNNTLNFLNDYRRRWQAII